MKSLRFQVFSFLAAVMVLLLVLNKRSSLIEKR